MAANVNVDDNDDDDYMSDSFLVESKDTKPGRLSWGKVAHQNKLDAKRKEAEQRNRSKYKPLKEREEEQRQKGLSNAISTQSKGFAMLQKMGYKMGTGLGKTGSGRAEPVGIEVKTGRGGLGRQTELKRRQEEVERMREVMAHKRVKMDAHRKGNFLRHMSDRFSEKETDKDLYNSQKACVHLDQAEGHNEPEVTWYWPKKMLPGYKEDDDDDNDDDDGGGGGGGEAQEMGGEEEAEDEEEAEEELPAITKLLELTKYLRSHHKYCVWCGTAYNDDKDLEENCPGDNAGVHR